MNHDTTEPPLDSEAKSARNASESGAGNGTSSAIDTPKPQPQSTSGRKSSSSSLPSEQHDIDQFIVQVNLGIVAWIAAGKILVGLVKEMGRPAFSAIREKCPWMSDNLLWNFYKIGTGELYPYTLILPSNAAVSRRLAALPLKAQKEICDKGLAVVSRNNRRGEIKPAHALTLRDVNLALGAKGPRLVSEQAEIIDREDHRPEERQTPRPPVVNSTVNCVSLETQSAGNYKVTLTIGERDIKVERCSGSVPPGTPQIALKPSAGKLQGYFELRRPKVSSL